jgi:hypothetical protein
MKTKPKKRQELEIVTITKQVFDKMTPEKQRMYIAQDVIDRIKFKQIKAYTNKFVRFYDSEIVCSTSLKDELKKDAYLCEVCAKGGLFMSYVAINNNFNVGDLSVKSAHNRDLLGVELKSKEMKLLLNIFDKQQLSLIETTFEGHVYDWNLKLTEEEEEKCFAFRTKAMGSSYNYEKLLLAICKNIITNKGTFKP